MSFRAMGLWRSVGVLVLVSWPGTIAAVAQMAKPAAMALTQASIGQEYAQQQARVIQFVNEEAITTTFVQSPEVGPTSGGSSSDATNWLKVEFHYGVNPEHPDKYPWLDSVQFKVWIEGRDLYDPKAPPGSTDGVAVCLTGAVTYINLQQSRDAYGVFFVHPTALARYCGSGTYENFDRKYDVRVIAYIGGKAVDQYDKNKDYSDWYTKCVPVPNLVYRQDLSPFALADVMRYPQIKMTNPDSGAGSGQ